MLQQHTAKGCWGGLDARSLAPWASRAGTPQRAHLCTRAAATRAPPPGAAAPASGPPPRAAAALAAALAGAALLLAPLAAPQQALAGQNVLDVPSCAKLKPSANGVKFCEVRAGSGDSPLEGDLVMVDYTARALAAGGKVFDGSSKFKFEVGNNSPDTTQVMSGFDLAILGDGAEIPPIKEGGVRTVVLPPALAYGEKGDGCLYGLDGSCRIPPNSEVELTFRYLGLGYGK